VALVLNGTWDVTIKTPIGSLAVVYAFDVVVDGDAMSGHSRAGRLPRSAVSGTRRGQGAIS
jgi:hypothetical protein